MFAPPPCDTHDHCWQERLSIFSQRQVVLLVLALISAIGCAYFAVRIAPAGLADAAPSVEKGLLPEWIGSRQVLRGDNPYAVETTRPIPSEVRSGIETKQYRYAYPVYFAFLFFPLAMLPFQAAQRVALFVGVALTGASIFFWLRDRNRRVRFLWIAAIFAFASYPIFLALQLRQPTVMIAAVLAATFYCVRSNRLIVAGLLAGITFAKPHIALPVLLPLSIWSFAEWRTRKSFLLSLVATLAAFLTAAEIVLPGWIPHWIGTLRAYAHSTGANPPLMDVLPHSCYLPACALLIAAIIRVSLNSHDRDLLFTIAFSIAAFELMLQFQIYNEVLLLPATLWILEHRYAIRNRGQLHSLLWLSAWALLGAGWASQAALSVADVLVPGSGVTLWQVPLAALWLYPWPLFLTLSAYAIVPGTVNRKGIPREAAK